MSGFTETMLAENTFLKAEVERLRARIAGLEREQAMSTDWFIKYDNMKVSNRMNELFREQTQKQLDEARAEVERLREALEKEEKERELDSLANLQANDALEVKIARLTGALESTQGGSLGPSSIRIRDGIIVIEWDAKKHSEWLAEARAALAGKDKP